jgi:RNA polymerase sigma factor (sigma-70 family)
LKRNLETSTAADQDDLRYALTNLSESDWSKLEVSLAVLANKFTGLSKPDIPEVAREILQRAVIRALEKADTYDPARGRVQAWLYGIARNELRHFRRDFFKKQKTESEPIESGISETDIFTRLGTLESSPDDLSKIQVQEFLEQNLDPEDAKLFIQYAFEGYSSHELAETRGISAGTFYTRISRIKQKLRQVYDQNKAK